MIRRKGRLTFGIKRETQGKTKLGRMRTKKKWEGARRGGPSATCIWSERQVKKNVVMWGGRGKSRGYPSFARNKSIQPLIAKKRRQTFWTKGEGTGVPAK